jgi:hypothetical protein
MGTSAFERRLQAIRMTVLTEGHDLDWTLKPAASEAEISDCAAAIGRSLPDDFREFLRMHNGALLSVDREPGLSHQVSIFGTAGIVEEHQLYGPAFRDLDRDGEVRGFGGRPDSDTSFWDGLISFAHYGDGRCLFDLEQRSNGHCAVLDLDLEDTNGTRERVIASSFDDWLSKILTAAVDLHRLVYWLPFVDDEPERP